MGRIEFSSQSKRGGNQHNFLAMTNQKDIIIKGVKFSLGAIPLMFLGPMVIHNAFMNKHTWIHYIVLGVGIVICLISVALMWKGIKIILKGLFDEQA